MRSFNTSARHATRADLVGRTRDKVFQGTRVAGTRRFGRNPDRRDRAMSAMIVDAAGLVAVAGVFGAMVFFAFVYAPLVFIKLGTEAGGRFIREVFPVYYVAMCAVSLVAAALLAFASAARGADALAMACIGIVFFLARFALLPIINRNRDAGQAGDLAAKKRFDLLHRVSVIVNLVQMLAVLVVLVRYAAY